MNFIDNEKYMTDIIRLAKEINFDNYKNKSILITGASGLICSFMIDLIMYRNTKFNDNIKIYMLCRNEKKLKERFSYYDLEKITTNNNGQLIYIIQDVCDRFKFNIDFDYIIHAASNTHPIQYATDPVGTIETNVIGMNNILEYSAIHKPKRIFMMSSVEIYGENRGDVEKFDENYSGYINCNTVRAGYPESKRLCESLCQAYISQYELNIVIGRLSRVYGPTMLKDDSKALSQFIKNAVNNEDIILKSNGEQLFSYTYISDAVSAIMCILDKGKSGESYNISDELSNIKLKDLAKILAEYNKRKVIFRLPDEIENKGYSKATKAVMSCEKLKKLGWKSYYSIKEGVINTVEIMKEVIKNETNRK